MAKSTVLAVFLVLGIGGIVNGLSVNFYNQTCPSVEQIVRSRMKFHFQQNPSIAAHLLRLQFHDCGATGCDASLLLTGTDSEQSAGPNETVLGYEIIADIKAQLEANCRGTVSCADIVALAGRDAVALTGGPNFSVPLGRFDSLVSGGLNVRLPSPDSTVDDAVNFFKTELHLSAVDFAILLGSHTIGVAHCSSFQDNLYNFQGTNAPDPSTNPTFLAKLQKLCPESNANDSTTVALDDTSQFVFDNRWYSMMSKGHGVLEIDQEMANSNLTTSTMNQMLRNQTLFFQSFAASMIKLGVVGVKNATTGNVRTNCSVVGTSTPASSPAFAPAPPPPSGAHLNVSAPVSPTKPASSPQIAPADSRPIAPVEEPARSAAKSLPPLPI